MSGSVLDLNGAYDDTWRADEPMFIDQGSEYDSTGRQRLTGGTPRMLTSSSRLGTPRALEWDGPSTSLHSPLRITNQPLLGDLQEDSSLNRFTNHHGSPFSRNGTAGHNSPGDFGVGGGSKAKGYSFPRNPKTPYEILGVSELATQEEIKKAYKNGALHNHPDLCRGSEKEKDAATRRFQLIAEAFAILGDPKRRAEYDISKRERARKANGASHSTQTTFSRPATFKSNFMPEQEPTPTWGKHPASPGAFSQQPQVDLTDVDPFYLFKRMYGDPTSLFGDNPSHESSRRPKRHDSGQSPFPDLSELGNLLSDPLQGSDMYGKANQGNKSGKSFRVEENHSQAHLNRHGQLNVTQSQKTFKVHKSGGFTFESKSVSGTFGSGSMDMMSAIFGGGMVPGVLSAGGAAEASFPSPFAALGGMMGGPPPSYRPRRQSLAQLEGDQQLSLMAPSTMRGGLHRSPSMNFDGSSHRSPLGLTHTNSPYAMALYDNGTKALGPYGDWNASPW